MLSLSDLAALTKSPPVANADRSSFFDPDMTSNSMAIQVFSTFETDNITGTPVGKEEIHKGANLAFLAAVDLNNAESVCPQLFGLV